VAGLDIEPARWARARRALAAARGSMDFSINVGDHSSSPRSTVFDPPPATATMIFDLPTQRPRKPWLLSAAFWRRLAPPPPPPPPPPPAPPPPRTPSQGPSAAARCRRWRGPDIAISCKTPLDGANVRCGPCRPAILSPGWRLESANAAGYPARTAHPLCRHARTLTRPARFVMVPMALGRYPVLRLRSSGAGPVRAIRDRFTVHLAAGTTDPAVMAAARCCTLDVHPTFRRTGD